MPYGIYTIPEVSSFGETEETCKEKGIDYVAGRALFADNPRGKITGDLEGITKLVVDAKSRKLLGVHVIGERASELVHIGQTAILLGAHRRPLHRDGVQLPDARRQLQVRRLRVPRCARPARNALTVRRRRAGVSRRGPCR